MRAVKDKNKYLNLISSTEAKVFNKIDLTGFTFEEAKPLAKGLKKKKLATQKKFFKRS